MRGKVNYPTLAKGRRTWGTRGESKIKDRGARLVQTFELGGGLEFAVEVAVDDLHEEFAEIGESGCGDGFVGEGIYGVAEHAGGEGAGRDAIEFILRAKGLLEQCIEASIDEGNPVPGSMDIGKGEDLK